MRGKGGKRESERRRGREEEGGGGGRRREGRKQTQVSLRYQNVSDESTLEMDPCAFAAPANAVRSRDDLAS